MENFVLKILDMFQGLFRLIGVNYKQLRAIVAIKLMMDNRRQIIAYQSKGKKEPGTAFLTTLLIYSLFGLFIAFVLYALPSFILSMIMFFSYIMVMIAMTLITDFSSILLDTSDNTIILPRPVDSRTLFAARLTHIMLYLGQLTLGLSLASIIVVVFKYGLFFTLCFSLGILLAIATTIFLTNGMYLVIMQFSSEEKLKNIINYFQIAMAVLVVGGYQIVPRMISRLDVANYTFEIQWWHYGLPPVWIAGSLEAIQENTFDLPHITLLTLALVIPVLGVYLVNQYLTPVFNKKLGSLGSSTEKREIRTKSEKSRVMVSISKWITTAGIERGAFEVVYKILGRDRKIKLKIYPAFGYIFVFGIVFLIQNKQDLVTTFRELPTTHYHLMLIYLTFMILQVALHEIPYSDDYKASWIYFSAPLNRPGEILSGTIKAIFIRLFIPGYILISAIVLLIWGVSAADDLLFGLFNNFLMLLIIAAIGKRQLPLSLAANIRNQSGNIARGILMVILIGTLGLLHYLLARIDFILIGAIPIQLIAIFLLHAHYKKTTWHQLTL
ncbi:MAG: hypothetical protein JNM57_05810 [Cyclobacteriaceae bacterium]|nr:hypothetical protein [Cyclobacteriaceae bacterium]